MREDRDWLWNGPIRGRIWREKPGDPWQAEFYPSRSDRRRKSTYTTDEAQAWIRLAGYCTEASLRGPEHKPFTLQDAAISAGQKQLDKHVSEAWRERCIGIVEDHLYRLIGSDFDLNSENIPRMADEYIRARRKEQTPSGRPPKYSNIRKELLIIQQGCRRSRDYGEFTGALAHIVPEWLEQMVKVEAAESDIGLALSPTMYLNLLRVATPWRRPWVVWARNMGIDIGPTHGIRKDDIDWSVGPYGGAPVPDYKNHYRPRFVPFNHDARVAVDIRMQEPGELLFEPMWSSQAFSKCMDRWCPKAGIPKRIRWKDLSRYTMISELGNVGAPQNHVASLVGHSGKSQMIERVYQQLNPEALAETVNTMPTMFGPSRVRQYQPTETGNHSANPGTLMGVTSAKTKEKAG
jgi:hypothetical protein